MVTPVPLERLKKSKICFVSHNASLQRNNRLVKSLSQKYDVSLIRSLTRHSSNKLLQPNLSSALRLSQVGLMSLVTTTPMFLDILAAFFFPSELKNYVLDYATPLSLELAWLGHRSLSKFVEIQEKFLLRNARAVTVPNELFEKRAYDFGASNVTVIPNYPSIKFNPTLDGLTFRKQMGLSETSRVAIFTAAGRLEEIYGLRLLLESWKIVEERCNNALLIIAGPRNDSEISKSDILQRAKTLNIRNLCVTGYLHNSALPDWINIADVCLAPRTKGFPIEYYDDKDSTKISEYAALKKPIVATGYSFSNQYMLVGQSPEDFAEGILKAFAGTCKFSEPNFWENNEGLLFKTVDQLFEKK